MFNFFKKKVTEPELPKDIIPLQVKSDMEYIKRIYDKLGLMWDNGDPRVEKDQDRSVAGTYRYYKDDYITVLVNSINNNSRIVISGDVYIKDVTRKVIICNTSVYHKNMFDNTLTTYEPIKWDVSDECKANVVKHIEENILNDKTYESLQVQFCKRISNKGDVNDIAV